MKRIFTTLTFAGLLSLAACSSHETRKTPAVAPIIGLRNPSIRLVVDNTRALPLKGTYNWGYTIFRVASLPGFDLAAADQRLHDALQQVLADKGFTRNISHPDLLVSYAVASGASLDEKTLDGAYEEALQSSPSVSTNSQPSLKYRRGTLIIDIVDNQTRRLLWRGAIKAEIQMDLSEQEKTERCLAAVTELLKNYPKPKK